ncbi:hypothetical protein LZ009_09505 [Ramlibacter sp. XY19]|uniref:hypothetical protein n=1 Tax=Ramlibacter paludis TaxID=2908000 RepID=UPI0023DBE287|nr:hypothetical protein [Ramlibacter paludis]MCG2593016.1 hypothetical protein [Ramlibacter paludis]
MRPLEAFGSTFKVHLSTALTFSPETLCHVVCDSSIPNLVRRSDKPQVAGFYGVLRKLAYVADGKHNLSPGLRSLTKAYLAPIMPAARVETLLDGKSSERTTGWRTVAHATGPAEGDVLHDVAVRLAMCDEYCFVLEDLVRNGQKSTAEELLKEVFSSAELALASVEEGILVNVMPPIETALSTLAWLDCAHDDFDPAAVSIINDVLDIRRRPMGNWLAMVCKLSDCSDLPELSLRTGISLSTLKKWSSSAKSVLPNRRLPEVLKAVRSRGRAERLENLFGVTRLLTFICDLWRAAAVGEPPSWPRTQGYIMSRYAEAYRLARQQRSGQLKQGVGT